MKVNIIVQMNKEEKIILLLMLQVIHKAGNDINFGWLHMGSWSYACVFYTVVTFVQQQCGEKQQSNMHSLERNCPSELVLWVTQAFQLHCG